MSRRLGQALNALPGALESAAHVLDTLDAKREDLTHRVVETCENAMVSVAAGLISRMSVRQTVRLLRRPDVREWMEGAVFVLTPGSVEFSFPTKTSTGRVGCSAPNLSNPPREGTVRSE